MQIGRMTVAGGIGKRVRGALGPVLPRGRAGAFLLGALTALAGAVMASGPPAGNAAGGLAMLALAVGMVGTTRSAPPREENPDSTLETLRSHMVEAQDGCLQVIEPASVPEDPYLEGLVRDYNKMIQSLRSTFAYVEECQNKVLAERNKIDALLQSLPGALLSVDENLVINTVNRQAEELLEGAEPDLLGRNLFDVLTLNEGDRSLLRDAFLYKWPIRNQELSLRVGGEVRAFTVNLSFLSQEDSDMGAVATLQDITEYKHLQESVYNREKLVAMGQLAAGVAHELNTPLGNILGYSQLMEQCLEDPQKLAQYTEVVAEEAKQCSRIVQDLLNYARKDQCMGDTCDLNQLIHEVNDTFINCRLKRHKVEIETDLSPEVAEVMGGCGELDIVFTNLILNAIQALKKVSSPRVVLRTWMDSPGLVGASVEDNGPGVSPEARSRIFDPFFTTKDVGEGTGLGLSISQAMLSKRGGYLLYDTEYTEGARFVLKLPAGKANEPDHEAG